MPNTTLNSFQVEARVFDDGMLGIKLKTDLEPGRYKAVVVLPEHPIREVEIPDSFLPLKDHLDQVRAEYVKQAVAACGGNKTQAAKLLGVDARTVFRITAEE